MSRYISKRDRRTDEQRYLESITKELERREKLGASFRDFVNYVMPRFQWYQHAEVLCEALQLIGDGKLKRLMVFEPPRHGKSQLASRLFPAWLLYRGGTDQVGLCSYAADLAHGLSRAAIDFYMRTGRELDPDASAKTNWMTVDGGEMWAAGVGGPITGKGFNYGIIDDPVKNQEEALSEIERERQKEWYRAIFSTREEPDAAVVLIMTRWHQDDLAGWLLSEEENEPQHWHIINFEAIKTEEPIKIPPTCTLESDWRLPGEALCPERYPIEKLESKRKRSTEVWWNALYQQRPTTLAGDIWKRDWFRVYAELPKVTNTGYDWDLAYTEDERNSACAYVKSCRDEQGNMYVMDMGWRWFEFPAQMKWMTAVGGPHFIENKASGKSLKQALVASGVHAIEVKMPKADKIARAQLASPAVQNGKVFVFKPILDKLLNDGRQGLLMFPNGSHNDLNDVFVQALNRHFGSRRGGKLIIGK